VGQHVTATNLTVEQAVQVALKEHSAGNLQLAESIYRQILARFPQHGVAMHYLGVLAHQVGRYGDAEKLIAASLSLLPESAVYLNNLGEVYRAVRRFVDAEATFRRALALDPHAEHVHNNLGLVMVDQNRLDEGIALLEQAARLYPNDPKPYCNLGAPYNRVGRLADAEQAIRTALRLNPKLVEAYLNLANVLAAMNRLDEALGVADAGIVLAPGDADLHIVRGHILLKAGKLADGFAESEWRLRSRRGLERDLPQPLWAGEPIEGKTILLYSEQGHGDAIQFVRYVPLVAGRGARVILEAAAPLRDLFTGVRGVDQLITAGDAIPPCDLRCSLLSLPHLFHTQLTSIPTRVPYLHADEARIGRFADKLRPRGGSRRIGIAWAGNPDHERDRVRSAPLSALAPLAQVADAAFYSLQTGPAATQLHHPPPGLHVIDLATELHSFADTAALMMNLDLVISVDTAVAHLAGALGCKAWTMLPLASEWRWLRERSDSPWYPTMTLFRQTEHGDWRGVAEELARALRA
jgi:tetratricopeptide (TPR) repeat protein